MTIPDFLPLLRKGTGATPTEGGCLVQVAGFLYDGHSWRDDVECVHGVLRNAGINVNDRVSDADRTRLALAASRISGSADVVADWSLEQRRELNIRLAYWCAASVVDENSDPRAQAAVGLLGDWLDAGMPDGWSLADAAAAATAAADAAYTDADAAAYTATADAATATTADAATAAAADAAYTVTHAAAYTAADAAYAVDWFFALCDEYDRLTGRATTPLTAEQGRSIRALSDAL